MANGYSGQGGAGSPTIKTSADGGTVSGQTTITPDPTLNLVAGTGITLNGTSSNTVLISSSGGGGGSGTVTEVATGTGLQGGPITTTGTIALTDTAVTPAVYTNATITVNQKGRITAASSGSGGVTLSGSTNNTITTVTGADAIQGEANLTFDGTVFTVTGNLSVGVDPTSELGFMGATPVTQQTAAPYGPNPSDPTSLVSLAGSSDANFGDIQISIDGIIQALQAYGLLQ
mgnify:CR=1 FL=1|tara:strand:- start:643 stop:1335 length:693 start_codon:yes stop_codon:yes gene_type:complete